MIASKFVLLSPVAICGLLKHLRRVGTLSLRYMVSRYIRAPRYLCDFILAAALIAGSSFLSDAWAETRRGVLEVPEKIFDFGSAPQGQKVVHEFDFKNSGNADLVIQRMAPSCGCTAVFATDNIIKPGQVTKIKAEFDTSGFTGSKTKTIDVFTSDLDSPQVSLVIKGTVLPSITVDPPRLDYGEVVPSKDGEALRKIVSVSLASGSDLSISDAKVFSKYITVERIAGDDHAAKFAVKIDPTMPRGPMRERVVVELKGGKHPNVVTVPVVGFVRGSVRVSPLTVSVGIIEGKSPIERTAKIENTGKAPLKVLGVSTTSDAVKASVSEIQPGQTYVVKISVDPSKVRADLRASVEIETDLPEEERITINVFGVMPPSFGKKG